ncbi:MAG: glycosyltransferase family 39 protein [Saprospiraceae bacterium]
MPTSKQPMREGRWILPVFLLLAVVIRWGTFYPSVINHDESTYWLIARGMLDGQTYLRDVFDTKPVGIFLVFSLLYALTAGSIFGMRLVTALVIGLTGWLLFRVGVKATGQPKVGWLAGVGYVLLVSIFRYYGQSPNTELFFVPLAVAAVYLAWGDQQKWYHYALAGGLLGIGFVIKYVIAADALAIGLILLWQGYRKGHLPKAIWQQCLPMTVVFFIPIIAVALWYWQAGLWDTFWFYTFEVTGRYPVEASFGKRLLFVLDFLGRFFPFTLLAIIALKERLAVDREWQYFLVLWLLTTTVMTLLPGKTFGHYQIQIMPALVLLAGTWLHRGRTSLPWLRSLTPRFALYGMVLLWLSISAGLIVYYSQQKDGPRIVAEILQKKLRDGETVYTGNYHQIVYHLIDQPCPTPYVHSSLLYYPHHIAALEIDLQVEANRIIHGQQPALVLLRTDHPHNSLTDSLYKYYTIQDTLPDKVWLLTKK